jgi:hypothetical protein
MRLLISVLASTAALSLVAVTDGSAAQGSGRVVTGSPPHAGTTGMSNRSPNARNKGANNPHFCPPGQRKKPGKGSAFNC